MEFQPHYIRITDDLYQSYQFAKEIELDRNNLTKAHILLTQHILLAVYSGKFRSENMHIAAKDGRIEYVATSPFEVAEAMERLYTDIDILLKSELSIDEVFFLPA